MLSFLWKLKVQLTGGGKVGKVSCPRSQQQKDSFERGIKPPTLQLVDDPLYPRPAAVANCQPPPHILTAADSKKKKINDVTILQYNLI